MLGEFTVAEYEHVLYIRKHDPNTAREMHQSGAEVEIPDPRARVRTLVRVHAYENVISREYNFPTL